MLRGLYTAASGMTAQQERIDVTSNNIANVNTTAFKKDRAEFQDLMYQSLNYTAGATTQNTVNPTGLDVGLGVRLSNIQKNFLQGSIESTGNTLDLAIEGKGFFQVTLPNGEIGYTRNGSFKVDDEGGVVNSNGYRLEPEIIIPDNLTDVSVGIDGTVTALDPGTNETVELGQITIASFVNPAGLNPKGDSIYMATDRSGDAIEGVPSEDAFGSLRQGMLEASNVQLVNELVDLITAQRAYEANSKSITTADSMLDTANRLKN